ncbi:hypothetical protein K435DRAFT_565961, partial [Dendrothele bispora CBS 962.96]
FTDLDLLVSRLDDPNLRDGTNYDTLLLLSDFLGPAPNRSLSTTTTTTDRVASLSSTSINHIPPLNSPQSLSLPPPLLGRVAVERRRKTKDGRVKIKLSLLDSGVDKCGICLSQFKEGNSGAVSPACKHAFHEKCL